MRKLLSHRARHTGVCLQCVFYCIFLPVIFSSISGQFSPPRPLNSLRFALCINSDILINRYCFFFYIHKCIGHRTICVLIARCLGTTQESTCWKELRHWKSSKYLILHRTHRAKISQSPIYFTILIVEK